MPLPSVDKEPTPEKMAEKFGKVGALWQEEVCDNRLTALRRLHCGPATHTLT